MLTVQLLKVLLGLLMDTHPAHSLILFLYMRVSEPVENFAKHIHNLHAEIRRKISLSNEEYKLAANVPCRSKEFNVGDYVMVRICPERIPKTFSKNFMQDPWALILSFVKWDLMHIFLICLMAWILALFSM